MLTTTGWSFLNQLTIKTIPHHRYGCSQSELDSSSLGRHSDDSMPCKLVGDADQVKLKLNFANQKVDLVLKSENEGFVFKINCI